MINSKGLNDNQIKEAAFAKAINPPLSPSH